MAAFRFTLQAVLHYREHILDLRRAMLAGVLKQLQDLDTEKAAMLELRQQQIDEIRDVVSTGSVDVDRAAARRYHAAIISADLVRLERHRELVDQQREAVRRAVVKADQDVKALEHLRDNQLSQWTAKQLAREDREREDQWHAAHR